MKTCSVCNQQKPLTDFYKKGPGYHSYCKPCHKLRVDAARKADWDAYLLRQKRWKMANPDKARAIVAKSRQKAGPRPPTPKHKKRQYDAVRKWRELNSPGGAFDMARDDYQQRRFFYGDKCCYCGGHFDVFDHGIPLSKNGGNWAANIYPACEKCNVRKNSRSLLGVTGVAWPRPKIIGPLTPLP